MKRLINFSVFPILVLSLAATACNGNGFSGITGQRSSKKEQPQKSRSQASSINIDKMLEEPNLGLLESAAEYFAATHVDSEFTIGDYSFANLQTISERWLQVAELQDDGGTLKESIESMGLDTSELLVNEDSDFDFSTFSEWTLNYSDVQELNLLAQNKSYPNDTVKDLVETREVLPVSEPYRRDSLLPEAGDYFGFSKIFTDAAGKEKNAAQKAEWVAEAADSERMGEAYVAAAKYFCGGCTDNGKVYQDFEDGLKD